MKSDFHSNQTDIYASILYINLLYHKKHNFFHQYFQNQIFLFMTTKNSTDKLHRILQPKQLSSKIHKNAINQSLFSKEIVSKNNSKIITQSIDQALVIGMQNLKVGLSFLKDANINQQLQNSIINLLNSYIKILETHTQFNDIPLLSKSQNKNGLNYRSVEIHSNQETSKKYTMKILNNQKFQHQKNNGVVNLSNLFCQKNSDINKISRQNLKISNQSKVFLPQINKKAMIKHGQQLVQMRNQNSSKNTIHTQNSNKDFSKVLKKIHIKEFDSNKSQIGLRDDSIQQISKTSRIMNKIIQQNKDKIVSNENRTNSKQIVESILFKASNICNSMDSDATIKRLKQKIANHLILIEKLQTRLLQFQKKSEKYINKDQKQIIIHNENNKVVNVNQLTQKKQTLVNEEEKVNQQNQQITILKQQLKQRQLQMINLWIIIQKNTLAFS